MLNGHGGNIYDVAHRLGCAPSDKQAGEGIRYSIYL